MKDLPTWAGKPIIHPDDVHDLDTAAAVHEFKGKLTRDEAESKAHDEYRRTHHVKGAAYHLNGAKAAQAAGHMEEAKKHGTAYALHMKQLGHDPYAEPPPEVRGASEGEGAEKVLRFKAHKSDAFLLDGAKPSEKDVQKAEPPLATPPAAQRPQLHSTVEGFMGGLKALPKGSAERGKMITAHMSSPAFLGALQKHPQGAKIHQMLTQHLNSASNAGFKAGGTVATAKSEFAEELDLIYRAAKILIKSQE